MLLSVKTVLNGKSLTLPLYVVLVLFPAGQGTHEALLAQGGLYADLWNRQQALENYGKEAQ